MSYDYDKELADLWVRKPRIYLIDLKQCHCGMILHLYSNWANQCPRCKAEYNGSGRRLAPRSQWGEETGESF
jgi:hypothetical protein